MSRLYITCWRHHTCDDFGRHIAVPMTPPLSEAYVEITHESIASEPFPKYTSFITVKAESDCAVAFGTDPVADPNYHFVEAGERLSYGALPGTKIAVIEVAPDFNIDELGLEE